MLVLASSMVMIWFNGHDVVTSGTKTKHINTRREGGGEGVVTAHVQYIIDTDKQIQMKFRVRYTCTQQ